MSATLSATTVTRTETLGPLTAETRVAIMDHARGMHPHTRRTFRRLLILSQERGLDRDLIARTAAQAEEHALGN